MLECKLLDSKRQTAFGPLCLLGHYLSQQGALEPLCGVRIVQKSIKHSPTQKLLHALMGILSGCKALCLRASKRAEGSTKGYFSGERNATGRQLLRVIAPQYKEVLFEKLYAGNTTSCEVLKESIREIERILSLAEDRRKRRRTRVRLDGGFGTDANLNWLMWRGYEFIAKGYGGKRAKKLAKSVAEDGWEEGPTKSQRAESWAFPLPPIVRPARARR
jgi:hypothetical protein